jgi:hypothetical protein
MGLRPAWTPARLPGLKLWLAADWGVYEDGGVTPATDGGTVALWLDRSGNGLDFSQQALELRPAFARNPATGLPEIAFVNHKLAHTPVVLPRESLTVVAAGSFSDGLNKPVLDSQFPRLIFLAGTNVAGKAGLYDNNYRYADDQVAGPQRLAWGLDEPAQKVRFYRNGAPCGSAFYSPRSLSGALTVMNTVQGMPHAGSMYELVLCTTLLDDADRAALDDYLGRWFAAGL